MAASRTVFETTDIRFESDVLKSDRFVLVEFWAEWCAPCKAIAPLLEEIAPLYAKSLRVAKLDVGLYAITASRHHVRNLPTLMLFKGGTVIASKTGSLTKQKLVEFIGKHIKPD